MKIVVLNGSPKAKSDTFRLTDAFLRGMNRSGAHEVHIVHVREADRALSGLFFLLAAGRRALRDRR